MIEVASWALWLLMTVVTCFIWYNFGYKKGAKAVLKEWRIFNIEYSGEECQHGYSWDDCPDCRH